MIELPLILSLFHQSFSGVHSRKSPRPLTASYTGLTISPKFGIHVQPFPKISAVVS